MSQCPLATVSHSCLEKNIIQSNSLKGVSDLICYHTLGTLPFKKKEPGEDNARPHHNELPVPDLRQDYGKYKVVFGGNPFCPLSNYFTAYFTDFWHKSLGPQLAPNGFQN